MNTISHALKESSRFDMNIYRGMSDHVDVKSLKDIILKNNVDILMLRIPTENIAEQDKLDKLGFDYLCADTLVYYSLQLQQNKTANLRNADIQFHVAMQADIETLNLMVSQIFDNYTNHYNSNQYINKKHITEGYQEWVRDFISKDSNDNCISWVVKRQNELVGFATCSYDEKEKNCEGVLYGVMPGQDGKGIYTDLIRYTMSYFKNRGYETMKVSTQIQNMAVQKVWVREGFFLSKSYNTFHINSLLDYSLRDKTEMDFSISESDVQKIAETTGDFNPIHFDDTFAIENKLDGKIAHGIIPNAMLTKFYGMEYPGNGTLFLKYKYLFLRPLYLNKNYRLTIAFPLINSESGIYKSTALIRDMDNNICLVGYSDLKKRIAL